MTATSANVYSQPDLPTGIFHCEISQIWHFSKAIGSENYRLALSGEKRLTHGRKSPRGTVGHVPPEFVLGDGNDVRSQKSAHIMYLTVRYVVYSQS